MLVGWGGNNGSTFTAGLLANKHAMQWETRRGIQKANYFGSLVMASTVRLGTLDNGDLCSVPMHSMVNHIKVKIKIKATNGQSKRYRCRRMGYQL